MTPLHRKLLRDVVRVKAQAFTVALVLGCGIMAMLMLQSTISALERARDRFYTEQRFAQVFARLERAPESFAAQLEQTAGIAALETRIVKDVMLPMADEPEPVPGRIISIPSTEQPRLNALHVFAGRLPLPGATDEVILLEQFARAHALKLGDRVPVVINGKLRRLAISGIANSPEYILAGGGLGPANTRRFAVLWMPRSELAPMFGMQGAFNDVSATLQRGASQAAVLDAFDRALTPYGGFHAYGRDRQSSEFVLHAELSNLRNLGKMIPGVFLAIAAFLVNVVISRMVFLERGQIAVFKAVGYGNGRICRHYLGLVALIALIAGAIGISLGWWSGRWMCSMYMRSFGFPGQVYELSAAQVIAAMTIAWLAAASGALGAVLRVARLAPAEAMRPPVPLSYRRSRFDRSALARVLGPTVSLATREITRRPLRFCISTAAIAMGIAIFVMGRFSWDSFRYLFDEVYPRQHREDVVVQFLRPLPARVRHELAAIPGVRVAEGVRTLPVRLTHGQRYRDAPLIGFARDAELLRILHARDTIAPPRSDGVIITNRLAEILAVRPGDVLAVEPLEGARHRSSLHVSGLIDEPFGMQAYAQTDFIDRLLREQPRLTSVALRVDAASVSALREKLKTLPAVLSASTTREVVRNFHEQTGEALIVVTLILTLSAGAISIGIVYNNARTSLSARARDLATLRILGFSRAEISAMFLGELALQVVLGVPLGLWGGQLWARAYAAALESEVLRFPLHLAPETYGTAACVALASAATSALLVRRKLDRLDLLEVMKAAE